MAVLLTDQIITVIQDTIQTVMAVLVTDQIITVIPVTITATLVLRDKLDR